MIDDGAVPITVTPSQHDRWRRTRTYIWSLSLVIALWIFAAAYVFRHQPQRVIDVALAQMPYSSTVGTVTWNDPNTLVLKDIKVGNFFFADSIVINATIRDLLRRHLSDVIVTGPQLFMAPLDKALNSKGSSAGGIPWTINRLTINRGTIEIDAGSDFPSIPVRIGGTRPVIINYLKLGTPDQSASMVKEQMVELENIHFSSPFDPLAPVLNLPMTRVRFTYSEIWQHKIREVDLIRPNLYLGEDLFWFTDQVKKERTHVTSSGPSAPWQVGKFTVQYGQLSVNAFGQPQVHFPFFFDTQVDNIRLDQLDKISAKSVIAIRHFTQDYPDYKIQIVNLRGKLEFSMPPSDAKANNVVPTIWIDQLAWNDIPITDVWSSITFDPTGIYAKLGGKCEKGLMEGNFEVYYTKGFTWNSDFFAYKIDSQPIAEKLGGKYMRLTGTLDGKISVQGRATEIIKCSGILKLAHPGKLEIQSVGDLLKRLPVDTPPLKRDAVKIALNALEFYPYQTGELDVNYRDFGGEGILKLTGPAGRRDFGIYWHPFATSKVAKDDGTH